MDVSPPQVLSFEDPRIEGYTALLLDLRAHHMDVVDAIQRFRERFPDAGLTFPDLGAAYADQDPRRALSRSLGLRQQERMSKTVERERREGIATAKRPIRREILKESREAMRQVDDELFSALDRAVNDEGRWRAAEIYCGTIDRLALRIKPMAQGCMDLGETLGHAADLDKRFLDGTAEKDDLFVRDGGGYALLSPKDGSAGLCLRREHWSRIIVSDAILLAWNLRYRGAGRQNETKGLSGEEGRRRGIAQAITGRRDGINTRSMRDIAAKVMPWLCNRYALRAKVLAVHRGIKDALIPAFVAQVVDGFPLDRLMSKTGVGYAKLRAGKPNEQMGPLEARATSVENKTINIFQAPVGAQPSQQTWFA